MFLYYYYYIIIIIIILLLLYYYYIIIILLYYYIIIIIIIIIGFIGYAPVFHQVVTDHVIEDVEDDQLYYTKIFLDKQKRVSEFISFSIPRRMTAWIFIIIFTEFKSGVMREKVTYIPTF